MRRFYVLHGHWHARPQGKTMNEIRSAFEPPMKKAVIYARFSTDLQNERSSCAKSQAGAWPYTSESAATTAPHAVGSPPVRSLRRRDVHEREGQFRTHSHPLFSGHRKRFLPRRKDFLPQNRRERRSC